MDDIQTLYDGTVVDFSKILFIKLNYYKDIIEIYFEYAQNPLMVSTTETVVAKEIPNKLEEIKSLWKQCKQNK